MVIGHIVLRHLTDVLNDLLADDICPECFLEQNVAAVLLIRQDALDGCRCPFGFPENRFDLIFFQPVLQISQAGAALISLVEFTHDFCLLWYDAEFALCVFFIRYKAKVSTSEAVTNINAATVIFTIAAVMEG